MLENSKLGSEGSNIGQTVPTAGSFNGMHSVFDFSSQLFLSSGSQALKYALNAGFCLARLWLLYLLNWISDHAQWSMKRHNIDQPFINPLSS